MLLLACVVVVCWIGSVVVVMFGSCFELSWLVSKPSICYLGFVIDLVLFWMSQVYCQVSLDSCSLDCWTLGFNISLWFLSVTISCGLLFGQLGLCQPVCSGCFGSSIKLRFLFVPTFSCDFGLLISCSSFQLWFGSDFFRFRLLVLLVLTILPVISHDAMLDYMYLFTNTVYINGIC